MRVGGCRRSSAHHWRADGTLVPCALAPCAEDEAWLLLLRRLLSGRHAAVAAAAACCRSQPRLCGCLRLQSEAREEQGQTRTAARVGVLTRVVASYSLQGPNLFSSARQYVVSLEVCVSTCDRTLGRRSDSAGVTLLWEVVHRRAIWCEAKGGPAATSSVTPCKHVIAVAEGVAVQQQKFVDGTCNTCNDIPKLLH